MMLRVQELEQQLIERTSNCLQQVKIMNEFANFKG